ncbi:related to PRI2-DNA-directed DNA polymerase alpha, 58 KD subunit (DNA primase) [Sporisorium reilianum f. sp. reilianum]|uniref:DNA primase large subunit n=1 Tax=Sporisorium reilianum f. sp. reilianum TaxID=72559 RepID=A0A2N8UH64_9BASI|nr:related to PRI2-DNA-directed DNA polymerase alpha, 58 KD subunit (DNA primase) [Sporisorium reilianum f. sp. reilianum]
MFRTAAPPSVPSSFGNVSSASAHTSSLASGSVARHHTDKALARYPHRLNFYTVPPIHEVTIEQFESWAIDRLKVLAEIESSQARNRTYGETKDAVNALAKRLLPLNANTAIKTTDLLAERLKDHVSHFVLRLAFCRSEDLRRRFVKAESLLFRLRFETDDATERESFMRSLNLDWKPVSAEEKRSYREQLVATHPKMASTFESETFFKVDWTRVTDLVEKRRVFMQAGQAWVPIKEQSSLVLAEFQSRLLRDLEMTARALPRLDEDDRLLPVLSHLSMGFLAGISTDYTGSSITADGTTTVTAGMVDALVKTHAPLCMKNLHTTLTATGHLKHYGRLQYNLFLKELGLPVEEALVFWRRSFKNMTDDKFNKEYRYNIRHGYGLEGRRMNYPAKSCARILTQDQPGPQDSHGCPFRHFSTTNLSAAMVQHYGLNQADQSEILASVKQGHYHVACTRIFEITHQRHGVKKGQGLDGRGETVTHPNRYFESSWKLSQLEGEADSSQSSSPDRDVLVSSNSTPQETPQPQAAAAASAPPAAAEPTDNMDES